MKHVLVYLAILSAAPTGFATDPIGQSFATSTVTSLEGASKRLSDIQGDRATVLVFLSFECPVAQSYAESLAELAKTSATKGVRMIGIVVGNEPKAAIEKAAKEYRLNFPIYRDAEGLVAKSLGATITPEVAVLDAPLVLRYRGRIDNAFVARLKKNAKVSTNDLQDALNDVLAGRAIKIATTTAIGCPIEFPNVTPTSTDAKVTYYRDVAPLLNQHCVVCHRPGEVAPFSLTSYEQARKWAEDIKEFTASRQMPPWLPHDGPGFRGERKLSAADIATFAAWVDVGAPAGNSKDAKTEVAVVPDGWRNGPPDLILTVPADFHLGATGADHFRVFVLPTGLAEDHWVVGYEVRPGNRRVVHHTLNFFDCTGQARELEAKARAKADPLSPDRGPGYQVGMGGVGFLPPARTADAPRFGGMGGWAPGQAPNFVASGCGWFLPKGADFLLQVHYHRDGKPTTDRTQIGFYFAKKPIVQPWQTVVVNGMRPWDSIPANAANHSCHGTTYLHTDALLHSVMPHMHLLGKSVKVTLTPPGGSPQVLVDIPHWDYNWQETYWFKEPIHAPAGSKLEVQAIFDNSAANSGNPNVPPKRVFQGEQTTNEMLFAFIGATSTTTPWSRVKFGRLAAK